MNGPFGDLIEELMFRKTHTIFELSSPGILYNNRGYVSSFSLIFLFTRKQSVVLVLWYEKSLLC